MTYCTSLIYTTVMIINIITSGLSEKRLVIMRRASQGHKNMSLRWIETISIPHKRGFVSRCIREVSGVMCFSSISWRYS